MNEKASDYWVSTRLLGGVGFLEKSNSINYFNYSHWETKIGKSKNRFVYSAISSRPIMRSQTESHNTLVSEEVMFDKKIALLEQEVGNFSAG